MEPVIIEDWLAELGRGQKKLANGTRLKIRNIMSVVFCHGQSPRIPAPGWAGGQANPMKYVRQSGRTTREHTILTPEQAMAIIGYLQEPVRTMALVDASTGLRASKLNGTSLAGRGLRFRRIHVRRGIVTGVVAEVKTDASKSQLPLATFVLDALETWRRETPYAKPSDWIFASPRTRGKKPFRANSLLRRQMRMAVAGAGVQGSVGWHTFRRSIFTWMIENNENV